MFFSWHYKGKREKNAFFSDFRLTIERRGYIFVLLHINTTVLQIDKDTAGGQSGFDGYGLHYGSLRAEAGKKESRISPNPFRRPRQNQKVCFMKNKNNHEQKG